MHDKVISRILSKSIKSQSTQFCKLTTFHFIKDYVAISDCR
jgi:hypothetical protein